MKSLKEHLKEILRKKLYEDDNAALERHERELAIQTSKLNKAQSMSNTSGRSDTADRIPYKGSPADTHPDDPGYPLIDRARAHRASESATDKLRDPLGLKSIVAAAAEQKNIKKEYGYPPATQDEINSIYSNNIKSNLERIGQLRK